MGWKGRARPRVVHLANRLAVHCGRAAAVAYHRRRGRLVICDRHPLDGLLAAPPRERARRFRRWLRQRTAPRPDLVIILDSPGTVLFARKREHSPERLERQRLGYLRLADRLGPDAIVLDTTRSPDAVRAQVLASIWRRHGRPGRGGAGAGREQRPSGSG